MVNDKLKFVGHTQAFELNVAGGSSCVGDPISLSVRSRCVGTTAVIYASDYLNKLSGERIERECKRQLDSGCRALVIDFRDTELVNSIGVSILLGVIDVAEKNGARVVFSDVNNQTAELFEMLGLTRHGTLAKHEREALALITKFATFFKPAGP